MSMVEITFEVAVITFPVAKITFVVAEITVKVAMITSVETNLSYSTSAWLPRTLCLYFKRC